ncbi:AAA-ATPase At3g28510 [Aegilops tauschii subsp. strangulata]|uniref:AAA+ ATPase domain-containing protein n=3 Tax=Aegilops tauschii TaxID=37682 RepID=A0A453M4D3_AEGTS|nr:AAA-ATPase At3g28510 [Aegilops tauschii subsp. strangulata]
MRGVDGASAAAGVWGGLNSGVVLSIIAVLWTVVWQNLQHLQLQHFVKRNLGRHARRLAALVDPYLSVTIAEYDGGRMRRAEAFEEVKAYLAAATSRSARHLRAEGAPDADRLVLSMVDGEEVPDQLLPEEGSGAVFWWASSRPAPPQDRRWGGGGGGGDEENRRFYRLSFLDRHREQVLNAYLPRVRRQGRAVMVQNRRRKLFTNISSHQFSDGGYARSAWTHVPFQHPKTFATLAMDPASKKEVIDDLDAFKAGKEWYERVGKAWKRGYLLHGPPGTGKSAMIAAMANHLDYDVYDIELTSVHSNTDLRKLFIGTTSKSIIVIEDIDCSLDLTGARPKKKDAAPEDEDKASKGDKKGAADASSKVTLSGLLNFIDGLWSACGGERVIVFTTNHLEKLDPALIRRGRMDKHIEMSYCRGPAFEFLAKAYLGVDEHELFGTVGALLREVDMTPADVAENLTPKSGDDDADSCLRGLVAALEKAREDKASGGGQEKQPEEEDGGVVAAVDKE